MAKKTITLTKAAKLMGDIKTRAARARLAALGYTRDCGRCGGTGKYSYNQTDGDRCFGCQGGRKVLVPLTVALVEDAVRRIETGELAPYFERAKARSMIGKKKEAFSRLYMTSAVGQAYNNEYKRACKALQCGAGFCMRDEETLAMKVLNKIFNHVHEIANPYTPSKLDPIVVCAEIDAAIQMVDALDAAWMTFVATRLAA